MGDENNQRGEGAARPRSRRRNESITPGKFPKFRSTEQQLKYFDRLAKKQAKQKEKETK